MAQPDFRILGDALVTASQQLVLVPNVPAVNNSQAILISLNAIQDDMRGLRGEVRGIREEVRGEVRGIREEVRGLREEVRGIQRQLDAR